MKGKSRKPDDETYAELRARIVAETSTFISECLKHPELAVHIPMIPVENQRFPRSFAVAFWGPILSD